MRKPQARPHAHWMRALTLAELETSEQFGREYNPREPTIPQLEYFRKRFDHHFERLAADPIN